MIAHYYPILLGIHSVLRWFVLLSGVAVIAGCTVGLIGKKPFAPLGRMTGLIYVSLLDTQFLIGILLSLASPLVQAFWASPGVGMKNHDLRFFAMEHTTLMILALGLAHLGAVKSRKSPDAAKAYSTALFYYSFSLTIILLGIPWWRL